MSSTVVETDLGKIVITPRANNLEKYDILDLIVVEGRAYLSLKIGNSIDDLLDETKWMKTTENTYDIAVRYGYEGTEEEWIYSLSQASEDAAQKALEVIAACEEAKKLADEAAENANDAADRSNTLSNNRDQIGDDGFWYRYNEETGEYENTGRTSKGNLMYAVFEVDHSNGLLIMETDEEYTGSDFEINNNGELLYIIE